MFIGCYLLRPFVYGYGPLNTIEITAVNECAKQGRVYITALSPSKFVVAVVPDTETVDLNQIGYFLRVAENIDSKKSRSLSEVATCKNWDFKLDFGVGLSAKIVGAFIGSQFEEDVAEGSWVFGRGSKKYLGYATFSSEDRWSPKEYISDLRFDSKQPAMMKRLAINGKIVGFVYEDIKNPNSSESKNVKSTSYRITSAEQNVTIPPGNYYSDYRYLDDERSAVSVPVKIAGAVFVIDCKSCTGRAGFGTRLSLTSNYWSDWDWGIIGDDNRDNKLVSVTSKLWTAVPDSEFHGKREQIGKHWWSSGIPKTETNGLASKDSETTDVFRWERRDWLDREQAVTLFASLVLGLGITLWTELLIVFLHFVSSHKVDDGD